MRKITARQFHSCPKFCVGCNKPLPMRGGYAQAQLGLDGHLYCHAMTQACVVLAVKPVVTRRAA
jgi:hypothetical protein